MPQSNKIPWSRAIRYDFWAAALRITYYPPPSVYYAVRLRQQFPDQFHEDNQDAIGCYCMGGEL